MPLETATVPLAYSTPPWPSLYWPINNSPGASYYLYYTHDIWRFTLYWTLVTYGTVHLAVSFWAVLMQLRSSFRLRHYRKRQKRNRRGSKATAAEAGAGGDVGGAGLEGGIPMWIWAIPLVYVVTGVIEAVLAGSMVGLILAAVYNAGYFKMSTWMPFLWGLINMLVLILASFSIEGGL